MAQWTFCTPKPAVGYSLPAASRRMSWVECLPTVYLKCLHSLQVGILYQTSLRRGDPASCRFYPSAVRLQGGAPLRARLAHIDFIGGVLMLGATSTLAMAIIIGGLVNSAAEIALFSASGALYLALGC